MSQTRADSLIYKLDQTKEDSSKVKVLQQLFSEYQKDSLIFAEEMILRAISLSRKDSLKIPLITSYNLYGGFLRIQSREDSAITVFKSALKLARGIQYNEGISDALVGAGHSFWQKGNFEKSEEYQQMNIEIARAMGDSARVARSYIGLGGILSQTGDYTKAMEYYTAASKRFLELGQERNYGVALGNIGYIQRSLENYESAIEYFKKSDSIYIKLDNVSGRAFAAYNLSVVYKNMGSLDSAMVYNHIGRKLYEQLGYRKRVSYCYFTMGEIFRKKEDFNQALNSYQKSLEISQAVDDSVQIGYSSMAVADMYKSLNNGSKAVGYLNTALKVAESMKLDILAMDVHERLAKRFSNLGSMAEAYQHLEQFIVLKDSLYTREKRELGSEIEAKYQNDQKTKEIALLASETKLQALLLNKRKNERNAIIVFALLAAILALLLYNQFRIKQKSNRELRELDKAKSNFFANISHEFRTPLTLIKGPIEHIEQNPEEPLRRDQIKMIRRNTNRVLELVNQLLDLSKIDQKSLQLKKTEGDIYKCLRAATSSFNSLAAQRNIDFRVEIPSGVLWAAFDRDKIEKIVYNLLSNAFKFSDDEETISFRSSYVEQELRIEVSDTGRGISKENLPFIFDRFYQEDSSSTKDKEGSGIGLSLSKGLVDLMDGTITVSSEIGKGSFFTVHLPIEEIKTARPEKNVQKNTFNTEGTKTFGFEKTDGRKLPKVLLVEDNEDMKTFLVDHLSGHFRIIKATNGEQGLKKANSQLPDLIITDLMMPKMDGIELCTRLKTDIHTSHIPVIMLTAKAGVENKIQGLETGADDYLTKPFDARELLVRTSNLIAQRQKLKAHFANKEIQLRPEHVTATSIDQRFLEQVLQLLESRYSESSFGVPDMQNALGMSKSQLHRKIKALTNESPGELLRNFRLKRAAQLISQDADTVTQIAYKVGFNDLSYFTKCFKALYGMVPSAYNN
ncbi:tetratricopeptide repeat protein [Muriicola sp. Z0-33]|uniref:tetratricopeptide repeat protein n=1 Tax=Muriicola sp. Z0-33 TaxID=2816957 RepID=UPI0022382E9B|nr:tetratricopeptide repeat protein [Muriicola sp. Z0-33]MCW5516338.1 tetratricopeptide repeat protein [Muriicola sp. Z0-33]